ncbi:MAG: GAF domain-containing protein [Candidatus Binatia bacterium]
MGVSNILRKVVRLPGGGETPLFRAWKRFVDGGEIDPRVVRAEVAESWKRSRVHGVDPFQWAIPSRLTPPEQGRRREAAAVLATAAGPILEGLFADLPRRDELAVILTDHEGFVVRMIARGALGDVMRAGNFREGESLREEDAGTTSAAIVARTGLAIQISAEEHYCRICHGVTCASAPVRRPDGTMIGIVSFTAAREAIHDHPHTLGMAIAAAAAVEQSLRQAVASGDPSRGR